MLHYLNVGVRSYGNRPVNLYQRGYWEFQAVVQGSCGPVVAGETPVFRHHRLWVFGPEHRHGWGAAPGTTARIVVAHFDHVPDLVRDWVQPGGVRSVGLTPAEAVRLEGLVTALRDDFHRPTRLSAMRAEHALLELSMLAMKHDVGRPISSQADHARRKVSQALAWYAEHLPERPGVAEVAAAVYVSSSHLRRLFGQAGHGPPLAAMHRVQIERACELMANAGLSLSDIAPRCGYASLSSFSRAFRAKHGVSPTAWRSRVER